MPESEKKGYPSKSGTWSRLLLLLLSCLAAASVLHGRQRGGPGGAVAPQKPIVFENVTQQAGLDFRHTNGASPQKHMVETMGSGGLFFDYDNDGWLDIFLVDGGSIADCLVAARARHRLYRNRGNGTFEDVTVSSRINHSGYGMGACAADYDNDGRVDLYITNSGADVLFRNNGKGTFVDVTRAAGLGSPLLSTSCAFGDVDNDGDVDLFVVNYVDLSVERPCGDSRVRAYCRPELYKGLPYILYRNNGNGAFTDVTREAGVYTTAGKGLGVVFTDYDDDGWVDVFVANDSRSELPVPQHRSRVVQRRRAAGRRGRRYRRQGQGRHGHRFRRLRRRRAARSGRDQLHAGGSQHLPKPRRRAVRGCDIRNGLRPRHTAVRWLWRSVSRLRQRRQPGPGDCQRACARQRRPFQPERQVCAAKSSLPQRRSRTPEGSRARVGARLCSGESSSRPRRWRFRQ